MQSLSTLEKSVDAYRDLLVLNKLPPKTRKNIEREHNNNQWNLSDLQEAIQKEVRIFKSKLGTNYTPQNLQPSMMTQLELLYHLCKSPSTPSNSIQQINGCVPFVRDLQTAK